MPTFNSTPRRLLILGGTQEARECASLLSMRTDWQVELSLAGRTQAPRAQPVAVRTGGFGGQHGLCDYLVKQRIDALLIATHPFATQIAANAAAVAHTLNLPTVRLLRAPWQPSSHLQWHRCASIPQAIAQLGVAPRRVFLPLGRQSAALFECAPQHHYLLRSIDPVTPRPRLPHFENVLSRGPFSVEDEQHTMQAHQIEVMICKNSGGMATAAKLEAAQQLGIEILMVERPDVASDILTVSTPENAIAALNNLQRV